MINAPVSQRDWSAHPPLLHPPYASTALRAPTKPLVPLAHGLAETSGPVFGHDSVGPLDHDLDAQREAQRRTARRAHHRHRPRPRRGRTPGSAIALIEIWQANAGRPLRHNSRPAPRAARSRTSSAPAAALTDDDGALPASYRSSPAPIPGAITSTPGGPPHPLFAVRSGIRHPRLVTQMYFPGDPLFALDPIYPSAPPRARASA